MTREQPYTPNDAAPGINDPSTGTRRNGKVERVPVVSSSLSSIGYDAQTGDLHVEVKSGKVFVYHGVPKHVVRNLFAAPSKGGFHANYVAKTYSFSRA